ncbi:hypothetical protein B296_00037146 [Ensete ventricosum]|uniref:Uncharacterized protein n=1 Tax=Ensete ventricosum TaxID=4639 RepID=A0A426ZJU2_ENSVE|nr:hypothetical protein B296_00037146 [Ensete ventricosum]
MSTEGSRSSETSRVGTTESACRTMGTLLGPFFWVSIAKRVAASGGSLEGSGGGRGVPKRRRCRSNQRSAKGKGRIQSVDDLEIRTGTRSAAAVTPPALRISAFSLLKLVSRKGNLEVVSMRKTLVFIGDFRADDRCSEVLCSVQGIAVFGEKLKPGPAKKEAGSVNDMQKPPIDEAPSNITKQKVAAAKQYIENHYKAQMKSLQDRKER